MKRWLVKHQFIIFTCVLVSLFAGCLFLYAEKDFVSQKQATSIAYGRALKNCISDNKGQQCLNLKLLGVSKSVAGPTDKGPDYWSFVYNLNDNTTYTTSVFVDLGGEIHEEQEVNSWYH